MTLKKQWTTIKENWLIITVMILVLFFFIGEGISAPVISASRAVSNDYAVNELSLRSSDYGIVASSGSFAPDREDRKITKTASMSTKVERGKFIAAEQQLKTIVSNSDSFLLDENSNKQDTNYQSYTSGSYTIKVATTKYDTVISQLREIGEVQSFSEHTSDITGQYDNLEINLGLEQEKLERYQALYKEAISINDRLTLNDRIFSQERTVKYLEESLTRQDQQVEFTTVSVSVTEEQSDYFNIALIKFKTLLQGFVGSFNTLVYLFFVLLPWAIILTLIWGGILFVKKRK